MDRSMDTAAERCVVNWLAQLVGAGSGSYLSFSHPASPCLACDARDPCRGQAAGPAAWHDLLPRRVAGPGSRFADGVVLGRNAGALPAVRVVAHLEGCAAHGAAAAPACPHPP